MDSGLGERDLFLPVLMSPDGSNDGHFPVEGVSLGPSGMSGSSWLLTVSSSITMGTFGRVASSCMTPRWDASREDPQAMGHAGGIVYKEMAVNPIGTSQGTLSPRDPCSRSNAETAGAGPPPQTCQCAPMGHIGTVLVLRVGDPGQWDPWAHPIQPRGLGPMVRSGLRGLRLGAGNQEEDGFVAVVDHHAAGQPLVMLGPAAATIVLRGCHFVCTITFDFRPESGKRGLVWDQGAVV